MAKINLEPYKGVRDFYPEENRLHRYIFRIWEEVAESFGYEKYNASVLEPLELYKSKSSEEIVNEQIYSFKDRGDREVALRPEMTPTVARMIAARSQDFPAPVRWYSTPNLFRYEKPQKGRVREHWQLNVDLFGVDSFLADTEILTIATEIMRRLGASPEQYQIKINSRKVFDHIYDTIGIPKDKQLLLYRIIDKKEKISADAFKEALLEIITEEQINKLSYYLDSGEQIFNEFKENGDVGHLKEIMETVRKQGIGNIKFSPTLTRGFDYYTGMVFEIFGMDPENPRSIFGGGRYNNLIEQLSGKSVPAVGFGMGDVTTEDFLITNNLLPKLESSTKLWVCIAPDTDIEKVNNLAETLREKGVNVGVDISGRKLPDQLKSLDRRRVPYVTIVGPTELESGKFKLRNVETREEKEGGVDEIISILKNEF